MAQAARRLVFTPLATSVSKVNPRYGVAIPSEYVQAERIYHLRELHGRLLNKFESLKMNEDVTSYEKYINYMIGRYTLPKEIMDLEANDARLLKHLASNDVYHCLTVQNTCYIIDADRLKKDGKVKS